MFLSPEYTPPDDNLKIIDHLQFLLFYYTDLVHSIPLEVTSRIDLVMAKLIQKTMSQIGAVDRKGRHKDIYTSGIETRKEIESSKTDYVANIYYRSKEIKHGMKLNTVAKEIEKELKEMRNFPFKKVPSLDRIKVYLMADSKIKKDFHKKGRFFVLHK